MLKKIAATITPVGFALSLFAFILGVRWAVFDRYGMTLPEWDQWDAEGLMLLAPWFNHDHFLTALFTPHNEHRVVLTKLLNLGLTLANGHWDQRLEATANALFPASLAVTFWWLARRHLTRRWLGAFGVFLGIILAFPFAWQNVLGGFHSQQFFLVGLALIAIALLPFSGPFSGHWWVGAAAALLGLFSMASGFFGAVVVIGLLGVQYCRRERTFISMWPTLVVCAAASAIGWLTRHEVSYHVALKAQNLHDFVFTILRSLQWPAPLSTWFALVLWLPWTWLVARVVVASRPLNASARAFGYFIIGLGGWVWLQLVATGYARGAGGPPPASRYIDTLVFGLIANALALLWLAAPELLARPARRLLAGVAVAWVAVFTWGAQAELREIFTVALPPVKVYHDYCEINVRNYLYTGNEKFLDHEEIPYPGAIAFLERIKIPVLRQRLPMTVRPPLQVIAASSTFISASGNVLYAPAPGLSPTTPPLTYRRTWGSYVGPETTASEVEFMSAPLRAPLGGYLKFEISGDVSDSGNHLELRDAFTGAKLTSIRPDKAPGATWRAAYVPAPSDKFVIYARAAKGAKPFAFSEPIEMPAGSYWAWVLNKNGALIAVLAAVMALVLSGVAGWRKRSSQV